MLERSYYDKTDEIIAQHGADSSSLIPIIQDIQNEYRYLPGELLSYVAEKNRDNGSESLQRRYIL